MAHETDRPDVHLLERGHVYFLYRPAVDGETPHGVVDLRRFYMVLHPDGRDERRLIVIGHKKLPDAHDDRARFWGFVDAVSGEAEGLLERLGESSPAGEGVYGLVRHGNHTHLAYTLTLPEQPGEVQAALNITPEGSYVLSVKNPQAATPAGLGLDEERKASFGEALQAKFGDRRFVSPDTPDFLDVPGAELLLMGHDEDVSALGVDLGAEEACDGEAILFTDLKLEKSERATAPLMKGRWF